MAPQPVSLRLIPVVYFASMVLIFASPYFVHRDRRILAEHTEWTPSKWFYYMPLLAVPFPILYVIRRYRTVENW
ncbi:hypothetical protein [Halococcoides cellulosivorans]|uniref:hypothetical protein n=1 Tax=Halococcoides cellulosivorans TaxID=1679096 RepID=UPI00131F0625|nr:hypothetical protein [Halococcoides cellulosivorans]